VGGRTQPSDVESMVYLVINEHDCNPRLKAYFNPASQHTPPFERG
jgi:hypothetical protein